MATTSNDILLLQRYAEHGDAQAFSELMGRYQDFVYATCLRVMENAGDFKRAIVNIEDGEREIDKLLKKIANREETVSGWAKFRKDLRKARAAIGEAIARTNIPEVMTLAVQVAAPRAPLPSWSWNWSKARIYMTSHLRTSTRPWP